MTIRIGINGFGRIGRMVFRAVTQEAEFKDIEVVAINDLLEPDYLAYMLQFDSVHGRFKGTVAVDGKDLVVNGKKIRLTAERDPANLKWGDVGVDVVVEATGFFLTGDTCQATSTPAPKKWCSRRRPKTTRPCLFMVSTTAATLAKPSCRLRLAPPTVWPLWPRCSTTTLASNAV